MNEFPWLSEYVYAERETETSGSEKFSIFITSGVKLDYRWLLLLVTEERKEKEDG